VYQLSDTIIAVSSPPGGVRVIVRISGPDAFGLVEQIASPPISTKGSGICSGRLQVGSDLRLDARLYAFSAPRSYTGEDVVELHVFASRAVTETLVEDLLGRRARAAGPGEFTARAYLNGKMDLAQAEAVNEVIVSGNRLQLAAAEKMLTGQLGETTAAIRAEILNCLSLIEAGLDFSTEDIEFLSPARAAEMLAGIQSKLEELQSTSIGCEEVADLPCVCIAGAPNAGKSTLLNALLGSERSIVSDSEKTTRDVLAGSLELAHSRCILFDCAGLVQEPADILDELSRQAAIQAIQTSDVVVFCVDLSKKDYSEDLQIRGLIEGKPVVAAATKSDIPGADSVGRRCDRLNDMFCAGFLAISAKTGAGIGSLRGLIDGILLGLSGASSARTAVGLSAPVHDGVTLTARHRQAIAEAINNVTEAAAEIGTGDDEVAAMMLQAAYEALSEIEQTHLDDQVLERIFSRFCIGK